MKKRDVLKAIVSGILTYSPLANAVMTAISSYASEKRNRAVNLFIEEMLFRMDTLEQSMSEHYLKSDEFCALATKSINKVVMDTRKQKVKLFSDYLSGTALQSNIHENNKFIYLEILDRVEETHLCFLHRMISERHGLEYYGWVGHDSDCKILKVSLTDFPIYTSYLSSLGLVSKLYESDFDEETGEISVYEYYLAFSYGEKFMNYLIDCKVSDLRKDS